MQQPIPDQFPSILKKLERVEYCIKLLIQEFNIDKDGTMYSAIDIVQLLQISKDNASQQSFGQVITLLYIEKICIAKYL